MITALARGFLAGAADHSREEARNTEELPVGQITNSEIAVAAEKAWRAFWEHRTIDAVFDPDHGDHQFVTQPHEQTPEHGEPLAAALDSVAERLREIGYGIHVGPVTRMCRDLRASAFREPTEPWQTWNEVQDLLDLIRFHDRTPEKPAEEEALARQHAERWRLAQTAFGRDALDKLAGLRQRTPNAWQEIEGFNGCGGERWSAGDAAKNRGKGYDKARKALSEMAELGMLHKRSRARGTSVAYRIADAGMQVRAELSRSQA